MAKRKPKRPNYSDEQRAEVCALLKAAGYPKSKGSLTAVAERVGIPARTISRWFNGENNPPPDNVVTEKAFDLFDAIESELTAIFKQMQTVRSEANYRELATAAGILLDKMILLKNDGIHKVDLSVHEAARERVYSRITQLANARPDSTVDEYTH